jgi:hypothetical protein
MTVNMQLNLFVKHSICGLVRCRYAILFLKGKLVCFLILVFSFFYERSKETSGTSFLALNPGLGDTQMSFEHERYD